MNFQESLVKAQCLIQEDEDYIVFNDGKPIRTHLKEAISVEMDNYFDATDYRQSTENSLIEDIEKNAPFSPTVHIQSNCTLKVIHMNDDEQYIDYHILIDRDVECYIINIYFQVTGKTKIKMDVVVGDSAKVVLKNITNAYDELEVNIRSFCLRDSNFTIDDLSLSDKKVRYQNSVYLVEEGSYCSMNNTVLNTTGKEQTYQYDIYQDAPHTTSVMNSYGISKNNSKLIFNCRGKIAKGAKLADMRQKTKGLIMDLYSSISGNPVLEIDENDVIANHGAAIGSLDEQELYYLMSRGLTKEESERLIVTTYVAPYYKDIQDIAVLKYILQEIETQLQA
ncbi:MAG: SufD family Fe-S cluster assembly protein [Bacilli bacterium]|nr:SufD family Fe-S cluster assembly protein [Bacilli bacterium]